ncbi:ribosomal protein L13e [Candidatus Pyrohabitans sp.]
MHRPVVKKSGGKRKGRGFSLRELQKAGIAPLLARKLGIAVDKRRKSLRQENIEMLKRIAAEKPVQKKEEKKEKIVKLEDIKGVGPKKVEQFAKAGIKTANELLKADLAEVSKKSGISVKVLERLVKEAEKLVKSR